MMMSMKRISLLVAFVVTSHAGAAFGLTQLLGNFEGGSLDGWIGASDGPGGYGGAVPPNTVPTLASLASPTVATLGTNALRISNGQNAQNFWAIQLNEVGHPGLAAKLATAVAGNGFLMADVTFVASQFSIPAGNYASWEKIVVQTTAHGWGEHEPVAHTPGGWNAGLGNLKYTYSWPLTGVNATTGLGANIVMSINYNRGAYAGQNAPSFFVDNIRLESVPEPTSLALGSFALAGLGLLRRRR